MEVNSQVTSASPPLTYSGPTATMNLLTLQTTDDNTTNRAFRVLSSASAEVFAVGPTGLVFAPNGTQAAPSYSFINDTGIGMFRSGATILGVTGAAINFVYPSTTTKLQLSGTDVIMASDRRFGWDSQTGAGNGGLDTFLVRRAAATVQYGAADAASPVAQTIAFQGSRGGTDTNTAGSDATFQGSLGTGTAASGKLVFKAGTPQASGTTQHVAATVLTLQDTGAAGTPAQQAIFADGGAAKPSISFASNTTTGMYNSAGEIRFAHAGALSHNFTSTAHAILTNSGSFILGSSADTSLVRNSAGIFGGIVPHAATATSVNVTAQTASIGTTNLLASATVGLYRVSYSVVVTTAATTSSSITVTMGWNNGSAKTATLGSIDGAAPVTTANASNTVGSEKSYSMVVYVANATAITYATTYASSGATPMQYALRVTLERLN